MKKITPAVSKLLREAVEILDDTFGNNGCNDYEIPNTPEMKKLWKEYNIYNSGAKDESDPQWMAPVEHGDILGVNDGILIFLLKKHLGLLKKK